MKKALSFVLLLALALSLCACSGYQGDGWSEDFADIPQNPVATITMEDGSVIRLELYPQKAPQTVCNFISLANSGFYDGLTFHRIIDGFMVQGGDPDHNGTGGSDKEIKGEFAANGVKNNISHKRGVISMARAGENPYTGEKNYDSASSQFFIVHKDSDFLDGNYAAFGYVTKGMEVVDRLATETPVVDGNGTVLFENQPVINSIKVID